MSFRCTLLADGPSDQVLLEVLRWLAPEAELYFYSATDLLRRLALGQQLYPAELYVVHRDAEREPHDRRLEEITRALQQAALANPTARLVPVRMTEAWFLIDQAALREASGNARGREPLSWPDPSRLEELVDPKETVIQLLRTASGHTGRRLKRFDERAAIYRLGQLIQDYSPLQRLPAFQAFESEFREAVRLIQGGTP